MLKVKPVPEQLIGGVRETIWPGDDAVDLEASDLELWCRKGEREGLVLKPGHEPTVIKWRPLDEFELARVMRGFGPSDPDPNFTVEACRYGLISVPGFDLRRRTFGVVRGLDEGTLRMLTQDPFRAELPWGVAAREVHEAMGIPQIGEVDRTVRLITLPRMIGMHVFAASFPARRNDT